MEIYISNFCFFFFKHRLLILVPIHEFACTKIKLNGRYIIPSNCRFCFQKLNARSKIERTIITGSYRAHNFAHLYACIYMYTCYNYLNNYKFIWQYIHHLLKMTVGAVRCTAVELQVPNFLNP